MKNPLVAVCITTFNRKNMLEKCLESVINQTYKNLEIIVSDNHSEDGTEEYMLDMAQKDKRIRYFRQKENLGMTKNANFAYEKVTGEYFIPFCDDDWVDLDYVEKLVEIALQNPNHSMILSTMWFYDENYNIKRKFQPVNLEEDSALKRIHKYMKRNLKNTILEGIWKTSALKQMYEKDGFFQKFRPNEDWLITIKLLTTGKCIMTDSVHYHKRDDGMSRTVPLVEIFEDAKGKNSVKFVAHYLSDAILEDKFFDFLNEKERKKISKTVYSDYIAIMEEHRGFKEFIKYIWRHPLFLFRKEFWDRFIFIF